MMRNWLGGMEGDVRGVVISVMTSGRSIAKEYSNVAKYSKGVAEMASYIVSVLSTIEQAANATNLI